MSFEKELGQLPNSTPKSKKNLRLSTLEKVSRHFSKLLSVSLIVGLLGINSSLAHPVAFKGSKGIMGHHSPIVTHNQLNYSFKHWFAMGVHHFRRPTLSNHFATLGTANFLIHRWNGDSLQANIYALVGGGHSELNGKAGSKAYSALQFDIEDRKYYFLAKHEELFDLQSTDLRRSKIRLGLAPYVGGFEDLHSWLVVDWTRSEFGDGFIMEDTTPMLRFFYQNLLFEIGQSFKGFTKFNYIIHF